jgi:HlyD family secretion protein
MLVIVSLSGCGKKTSTDPTDKGAPVSVSLIQQRNLNEHIDVTGTLQPVNEVLVGPKLAGRVVAIIGANHQVTANGVPLGVTVKRDEIVARMDNADALVQIQTADQAIKAAKAHLEQARSAFVQQRSATDAGILNAKAALESAEARKTQAESTARETSSSTEAQIKQAQQALSQAKSKHDEIYKGSRDQERRVAENAVKLAKANLDLDKSNYSRYMELNNEGAVAQTTVDAAKAQLDVAQAQYDSAQQQLDLTNEGARQEDKDSADAAVLAAQAALDSAIAGRDQVKAAQDNIRIADAGIDQAKAALQTAYSSLEVDSMRDKDILAAQASWEQAKDSKTNAETTLSNTVIRSPVDGVVAEQLAQVGQSIAAAISVLRITTDKALVFQAKISELDAERLAPGQAVSLSVDAQQGDRDNLYAHSPLSSITDCSVERVVPVIDAKSRSFIVRVIVNKSTGLYPGMFAHGTITVAQHNNVVAVPKDAVLTSNGQQIVFTVEKQTNGTFKTRQRAVALGAPDGDYIQVLSGVVVGDQVITVGQQSLNDGDSISLMTSTVGN